MLANALWYKALPVRTSSEGALVSGLEGLSDAQIRNLSASRGGLDWTYNTRRVNLLDAAAVFTRIVSERMEGIGKPHTGAHAAGRVE